MTLLHFIVKTVREKFPDVASFDTELKYVEKAATGSADFQYQIFSTVGRALLAELHILVQEIKLNPISCSS